MKDKSIIKIIDFKIMGDDRGSLVPLEAEKNIPFAIKRVYYIFGTKKGVSRGFHAHKNLKQIAVCLSGSCRFVLDNGRQREEIVLNSPDRGLLIEEMIWREMHDFSEDCVIMVLANKYYEEEDYTRDYQQFLREGGN